MTFDLDVADWGDLDALSARMDELAAHHTAILRHARTWAFRRDGFEPSPVCLLRPLADVMDLLAAACEAAERTGRRHWDDLAAGVSATATDLRRTDLVVAAALPVVG